MPRILITGGNGFLGSHLAFEAIRKGMEVVVVDDFSTSSDVNVPAEVHLVKSKIEDFTSSEQFDYVAHLAARPSPEDYISNPVSTLLSNSVGTLVSLEIARKSNAIYFYTSSSEVYGEASLIPTPESYYGNVNPNGVRSCYDEGKRYSEALIMAYHRQHGLDVRIQRPFNVYGPRIRPDGQYGRVIPRFIMQSVRGEPITIHGDGKQTRSFLFVDDWLAATNAMLELPDLEERVLNIGSEDQVTILQLAEMIKSLTKSRSDIVHLERREDDPTRRSADNHKAKFALDWTPEVSLERGLRKTIEWMKDRYS